MEATLLALAKSIYITCDWSMLKLPPCSQSGKLSVISDHCALLRDKLKHISYFIIRCKFFFLFIG